MRDVVTEMSQGHAWVRIWHGFPFEDHELEIDRQYHRAPALYRVESEDRGRQNVVRTRRSGEGLPSRSAVPLHERIERHRRARAAYHVRQRELSLRRRRIRILKRVRWSAFHRRGWKRRGRRPHLERYGHK